LRRTSRCATGGTYVASGTDSPGIYSTGSITVSGATFTEKTSENIVIEGANSATVADTTMASGSDKSGVMIYQSMSGDASGSQGTVTMSGGSLATTSTSAPAFYVTNSTGVITLTNVKVTEASGVLVKAAAGNWGTSGSNGGTAKLTASGETLTGDVVADSISSVDLSTTNGSTLTGAINADRTAKSTGLTLDGTSSWTVTRNSHVTTLVGASRTLARRDPVRARVCGGVVESFIVSSSDGCGPGGPRLPGTQTHLRIPHLSAALPTLR
jgi:hypothetical protein